MVFDKIRSLFTGPRDRQQQDKTGLYFYVKCAKCGTPVRVRADRQHDLLRDYDEGGYVLHKDVMDSNCYTLFHFDVRFNESYDIIERNIEGGEFITREEYEALTKPEAAQDES
ncbi:MAG: hypothetical protein ACP5GX_05965 [Anaerolineae bacterium]